MSDRVTEHLLLSAMSQQQCLARLEQRSDAFDRDDLATAWRTARETMSRLEEREAGCADDPGILPMPPEMAAQVDAVVSTPAIDRAFGRVPVMFGLIELDATMTSRSVLIDERLEAMKGAWPALPEDAALAAACLPHTAEPPPASRVSFDGRCLSIRDDHEVLQQLDIRFETGAEAQSPDAPGSVHTALHLRVGTPPPLVHAVRFGGRLMLVDGHHRARVLRALGVTFLPCIVSVCSDVDDVLAAAPAVSDLDLDALFDSPRPPMLRDFGRSTLVHTYRARRPGRLLQWRIEPAVQWLP
jgi:hypothetical protein